jgi:hypothetical protein
MKLLRVPQLCICSGEALQTAAVFQMNDKWKLSERVQLMCIDTNASSTDNKAGACVTYCSNNFTSSSLTWHAGRYHVHKPIVANVFYTLRTCSSGSNVSLFETFSAAMIQIDIIFIL